jgi:hypothetical protein
MYLRFLTLSLGLAVAAEGATFTFDFESETATAFPRTGALTSLSMSQGGFTLTITREGTLAPGQFDIVANVGGQAGKPASWGLNSLDPFFQVTSPTAFILNFSHAVNSFRVEVGDYGADTDDRLSLAGYSLADLGGVLVDSDSVFYGSTAFPGIVSGTLSGNGIRSVRMIGGGSGTLAPHSMFYDNLQVDVDIRNEIPEPATCAMLGGGLLGFTFLRRRKQKL